MVEVCAWIRAVGFLNLLSQKKKNRRVNKRKEMTRERVLCIRDGRREDHVRGREHGEE